jgi:hypothetical protein
MLVHQRVSYILPKSPRRTLVNVLGVPELGIIFFEISNVKRFRSPKMPWAVRFPTATCPQNQHLSR